MRRFDRLDALGAMARDENGNWWRDLLRLWGPCGTGLAERPLRLAVRDNSLNLYLRGQSLARIGCGRDGVPYCEVHVKYVFPKAQEQAYARLCGTRVSCKPDRAADYTGAASLRAWMALAAEWETPEKGQVERVCADNAAVIDLEMGLSPYGERTSPLRIDLVALEGPAERPSIVFWEAKRVSDGRTRSRSEEPEVMKQIRGYTEYLSDEDNRRAVIAAYKNNCRLLVAFADMAGLPRPTLGAHILKAADPSVTLDLDPVPRLLLLGTGRELAHEAWLEHHAKLERHGVRTLSIRTDGYRLDQQPDSA